MTVTMLERNTELIGVTLLSEVFDSILAEKGADHRNREPGSDANCYYSDPQDGTPSCLVGCVLDLLGLHRPEKDTIENNFGVYSLPVYARFTPEAQNQLVRAQNAQDSGGTWGEAIAYAKTAADDEYDESLGLADAG